MKLPEQEAVRIDDDDGAVPASVQSGHAVNSNDYDRTTACDCNEGHDRHQ